MDDFINDLNSEITDLASVLILSQTGELKRANWGFDMEAEIVFHLSDNFGVGLGVGRMRRTENSMSELSLLAPLMRVSISWNPEYTVIPISLTGYYTLPLANRINVFFKAGIGYYAAKVKFLLRQEFESFFDQTGWELSDGEATDSNIGFHGGLGFEFDVTESFALVAEGSGRYVRFNDWDVENVSTGSFERRQIERGTFWAAEEFNGLTGKYYLGLELSEQKPNLPGTRNVRKAEIGFSGFSFRIGVKIRFGKS